jgi:hypothetical protein
LEGALKIETFLGPEMAMSEYRLQKLMCIKLLKYLFFHKARGLNDFDVSNLGPQKVEIFRAQPPSKWIFPHQNHFVPHHINNRHIKKSTAI